MYKVIIADDEPWVVKGLEKLIDWNTLGFEIYATASNGLEVMEHLNKENDISLVLTDIRMPGMDGIELIKQIYNINKSIVVIIISGFSEFSYAQEAIKYGVFDYLVKQVPKEDLQKSVEKAKIHLDESKKKTDDYDRYTEIISQMFSPSVNKSSVCNFCKSWIGDFIGVNYAVIKTEHNKDVKQYFDTLKTDSFNSVSVKTGKFHLTTIIIYNNNYYLEEIYNKIMQNCSIDTINSVMGVCVGEANSPLSYLMEGADRDLNHKKFFETKNTFMPYKFNKTEQNEKVNTNTLISYMKNHDIKSINIWLQIFYENCKNNLISTFKFEETYNNIMLLYQKYFEKSVNLDSKDLGQLIDEFGSYTSVFQMFTSMLNVDVTPKFIVENDIVIDIINYINESYTTQITLKDLAYKFNISQGHLSNLLKKETGKSFINHIIDLRIEKANQYFETTSYSVGEVSELVGYTDYYYFNRIYKRKQGYTPGSYRKNLLLKNN